MLGMIHSEHRTQNVRYVRKKKAHSHDALHDDDGTSQPSNRSGQRVVDIRSR